MRVAFCTNVEPVFGLSTLRGRNGAIIDRLRDDGHEVDVLRGPERAMHDPGVEYDVGLLCPNDLYDPTPDPAGRLAAETAAVALELRGVPFVNSPLSRQRARNKLLAYLSFRDAGLPQPRAWTLDEGRELAWPRTGFVVKPIVGSGGVGVTIAHSQEEAEAHAAALGEPCFLQELVIDPRCIRVVATQEKSIGRYEKRTTGNELVAAVSSGAEEVELPPSPPLDDLAVAMVRALDVDLAGVDVLAAADGDRLYALEANVNFGFYPFNREILDAIAEQVSRLALRGA